MTPSQRLILLAKSTRSPSIPPHGTDRLSKRGVDKWKNSSQEFRDDYLEAHPQSAYKKIRVNTPSERVSKDPDNQDMKDEAEDTLKAMGFKAKTPLKKTNDHLLGFLMTRGAQRRVHTERGTATALKVLDKLKGEDRKAVKDDALAIIGEPRKKPSAILNNRGSKGLIVGLIGVGVCAAMLGTGLVSPSFVAFVGVKALDYGIEKVRNTLSGTSIDEFLIAATIGNFVNSDSNGGFFENLKDSFKKAFGHRDEDPSNDDAEDDEAVEQDVEDNDNDKEDMTPAVKKDKVPDSPRKTLRVA